MLYFSEIYNKRIFSLDGIYVGRLIDFVFLPSNNPLITKMIFKDKNNNKVIISIEHLVKINNQIKLDKNYLISYLEENELCVVKNLLDKQIIDIKKNKIVRVNDVAINQVSNNKLIIAGVDIGILGLARRVRIFGGDLLYKFLKKFFNFKSTSNFLSWAEIQPLELRKGVVKLKNIKDKLKKILPEDLADYLERTNIFNTKNILKMLNWEKASEVIGNLNLNYQISLFKNFRKQTAAKFLSLIDPDEAADILLNLPCKKREEIIQLIPKKERKKISNLLTYSNTPIGNLITNEFLIVNSHDSVYDVIKKIKKYTTDYSFLQNIYVTNKENKLIGVFNLHELLLQDLETPIYKFMIQNLIVIHLKTPLEIVLRKMLKYKLFSIPVIDEKKQIIGIVNLDDLKIEEKL